MQHSLMRAACFCLSLLLLPTVALSQVKSSFVVMDNQFFLGKEGKDIPRKLVKAADATLVVGGTHYEENESDVYIIKADTTGEVVWEKQIAIAGFQELRSVKATEDGGVVFVGVTSQVSHTEAGDETYFADGWVGKLNIDGDLEWLQTYGGQQNDKANDIAIEKNTFFIVGGSFSKDGEVLLNHGGSDVWGVRIDSTGNPIFLKTIGGKGNEWAECISTCANGDYIIAGFSNSAEIDFEEPVTRNGNGLLLRISSTGTKKWIRSFPTPYGGIFHAVQEDADGRLIVAGSYNLNHDDAQFWVLKLTAEGKTIFDKKIGSTNDEVLTSVIVCKDTTYLCGGYSVFRGETTPYTKGKDDFILFKLDKKGNIIWRKTLGGPDYERCVDICEFRKGVYWVLGEKDNYFTQNKDGNKDFWLVKLNEYNCDSLTIKPDIFVRADAENQVIANHPIRFRARHNFGEKFNWDFGDGTFSKEEQPLKSFRDKGVYDITLTIYINETCRQEVVLPTPLIVKEKDN